MTKTDVLSSAMADEQIAKLEARKVEIAESVEQRKAEFDESDVEKRDSILSEVEEMTSEAKSIDDEIAEMEETRNELKEQEERMSIVNNVTTKKVEERKSQVMENIDVRSTPEFVHTWREAVMSGDERALRSLEKRDGTPLLTTMNSGTAPIPTYLQGKVEAAWERLSILNELSISNYKGIVAVPYEVSATGAAFHTEGAEAPTEEELVIGQTLLQPVMIKKWLRVSDEVQALTDEQFMDYVADEIIYQVNLFLEGAVVASSAAAGVKGIINSSLAESVASALSFNSMNEGLAELVEAFDPVVIVNRKTFFANIMGLTDLQGRPIYQIAADNAGKPRYYVNGLRVLFSNALADYTTASDDDPWAIVGDLKAYRLNLPEGRIPSVLYDPYTEAEADMNKYVGRILAAGDIVRPKAIAVLTKPGE